MRIRLIFALGVSLVAGLVYCTPLDMRDGRDLPNHGAPVHETPAPTYRTIPFRAAEAHLAPEKTAPTTTTLPPPPETARCPDYWHLAEYAGWDRAHLEAIDLIMWRESRCTPDARSATSDSGLLQINDIHLEWLKDHAITAEMLFDPLWNLIAGRLVSHKAESYGWDRFQPWSATYP
jgi:hypothetical protein